MHYSGEVCYKVEAIHLAGGQGSILETPVPSSQLCYGPKTTLKNYL